MIYLSFGKSSECLYNRNNATLGQLVSNCEVHYINDGKYNRRHSLTFIKCVILLTRYLTALCRQFVYTRISPQHTHTGDYIVMGYIVDNLELN